MGRSKGTKDTQGVNGDAIVLQQWHGVGVSKYLTGAPCAYEAHRDRDYRFPGEPLVRCGVCHPPARGLEVERVDERLRADGISLR